MPDAEVGFQFSCHFILARIMWFCQDKVNAFCAKGVRHFELHNEPNMVFEGLVWANYTAGVFWKDGATFGEWFIEFASLVRASCPHALIGWPGLSPGKYPF
jgi:hypothetical protein